MPIFQLPEETIFPPPDLADESGILAVGGDLTEERLVLAYSMGIFPWYSQGDPILWWSPDPRLVLFPGEMRVSRSLKQIISKGTFKITMDTAFESVIKECASVHKRNAGDTWITDEMIDAYIHLHHSGFAHSVESWSDDTLVGGLYGVSLGSAFFGESMYAKKSNASKVAFVSLIQQLVNWKFTLIDCQVATKHLKTFGAHDISRTEFIVLLKRSLEEKTRKGKWTFAAHLDTSKGSFKNGRC
jgi:leucyl/phenylalanyl-tRNA--protein transferase